MSNEKENPYSYDPFNYYNQQDGSNRASSLFPFFTNNHSINNHNFDDTSYNNMTFTHCLHGSMDYNSLSRPFDISCSSFEATNHIEEGPEKFGVSESVAAPTNENIPSTPNSSISSSSNDAADEGISVSKKDKLPSECEDGDDKSKKPYKLRRSKAIKKEKGKRQARFAFLTKSEIDNLEDGYRWRKYGQKAVKNSSYPRSYYRCTSQKCTVKKRVERSFEDPSIIITTYEGQHNHHCPATLRGNASSMLSPSLFPSTSSILANATFPQDLLSRLLPQNQPQAHPTTSSFFYHHLPSSQQPPPQQQPHVPDYGLLQDLLPSFIDKQHP